MSTVKKNSVTAQLRVEIQKSGQSLRTIAEATGIDATQLSRWMRGERGLTGVHVDRLAGYFGLRLTRGKVESKMKANANALSMLVHVAEVLALDECEAVKQGGEPCPVALEDYEDWCLVCCAKQALKEGADMILSACILRS